MDPAARRHETLLAWRSTLLATSQGPVPSTEDLRAIAVAGAPEAWPPTLDPSTVEPWRPTIEWLLQQVRFGVSDPAAHLPSELMRPVRAERPASGERPAPSSGAGAPRSARPGGGPGDRGDGEDPEMAALRRWRDRGVARNEPGFSTLRDAKLRLIVSAPTRDPAELAKLLGHRALRGHAREVADLLDAARSGGSAATAGTAGAPRTPQDAAPGQAARTTPAPQPAPSSAPATVPVPVTRAPADAPARPVERPVDPAVEAPSSWGRTSSGGAQRAPEPAPAAAPAPASAPSAGPPAPSPAQPAGPAGQPAASVAGSAGPTASPAVPTDAPWAGAASSSGTADLPGADDFDPFDYTAEAGVPAELRAARTAQGLRLQWPEWEAPGHTLFRVVSGDEYPPYTPESGELVAVTADSTVTDVRPFVTAVRHYQVWRNSGPDRTRALRSQPQLHAAASVVGPVRDVDIRADGGRVIGQWHVPDGVDEVHVYRIPVARAAQAGLSQEFRILADEDNLGGFVDAGVTRGTRYVYRVCAVARVDGVGRLSAPVTVEVAVSAVLAPVEDLHVEAVQSAGSRAFVLRWTDPPAGRVAIYRSPRPPLAGAATEARPVEALPQMQLEEHERLTHPIKRTDAGASMHEVPWPDGWTRAYFTPVTVLEGMARVGTTAAATWVPPVGVPRLVERVNRQVLTFAWPPGAASVLAHIGPRGTGVEAARGGGRTTEISEAQYRDLGGLTFPFLLPAEGCAVHVVPVAFASGERVEGVPVTVDYPGLLRMAYTVTVHRNLLGRPTAVTVEITSQVPVGPPPFALVHNADRLPLDIGDGTALEGGQDADPTLARTYRPLPHRLAPDEPSRWKFDVKGLHGFVRLFVDLPPQRLRQVALLDPPVSQLHLEPQRFGGGG